MAAGASAAQGTVAVSQTPSAATLLAANAAWKTLVGDWNGSGIADEGLYETALRGVDPRAADRLDLLTVVEHELGRRAGLGDLDSSSDGLMSGKLLRGAGWRKVLTPATERNHRPERGSARQGMLPQPTPL